MSLYEIQKQKEITESGQIFCLQGLIRSRREIRTGEFPTDRPVTDFMSYKTQLVI